MISRIQTKDVKMIQVYPRLSTVRLAPLRLLETPIAPVLSSEASQMLGSQLSLAVSNKFFHRVLQTLSTNNSSNKWMSSATSLLLFNTEKKISIVNKQIPLEYQVDRLQIWREKLTEVSLGFLYFCNYLQTILSGDLNSILHLFEEK